MDRDPRFEVVRQFDVRDAADRDASDLHLVAADELIAFGEDQVVGGAAAAAEEQHGDDQHDQRERADGDDAPGVRPRRADAAAPRRGARGAAAAAAGGLGGLVVATGFLSGCAAAGESGIAAADGLRETVGSGISPSRAISLVHSAGASAEAYRPATAREPRDRCREDDADRSPRARAGDRPGGARVAHQADDAPRPGEPLQHQQLAHRRVGDGARDLVAGDGHAVDRGDARPTRWSSAAPALGGQRGRSGRRAREPANGGLQTGDGQVLQQREHALVDPPR